MQAQYLMRRVICGTSLFSRHFFSIPFESRYRAIQVLQTNRTNCRGILATRISMVSTHTASATEAVTGTSGTGSGRKKSRSLVRVLSLSALATFLGLYGFLEVTKSANQHPKLRKARVAVEGVLRFLNGIRIGLQITLDYKWNLLGIDPNSPEGDRIYKECHRRGAAALVHLAQMNGGLYIKLGQGFASMNHILPEEYTTGLSVLQDQIFRSSIEEVKQIFIEDFGKGITQLFSEFEEKPMAAASLAQVFRARTHRGQEVAVKVQYIDMLDRFDGDLWTCKFLMDTAAAIFPGFDFSWALNDARAELEKELDFVNEAHNGERCARDLSPLGFVHVPSINWALTSKRVLTAEFIDGCKITDLDGLKHQNIRVEDAARMMILCFARQIFTTGFVHADPHPGNVLIRRSPVDQRPQLVLIDHGLYIMMSDAVRHHFCNLWRAVVLKDTDTLRISSKALGVDEYKLWASILFQRPYDTGRVGFSATVTKEDLLLMQKLSSEHMDQIVDVLKRLPRVLVLLMRNINLTRSLNKDLGNPVNRYIIMGREAVRGLYHSNGRHFTSSITKKELPEPEDPMPPPEAHSFTPFFVLSSKIRKYSQIWLFDVYLQWYSFRKRLAVWYLRILQWLGRAPEDLGVLKAFVEDA